MQPDDLVFGDLDGVVIVPKKLKPEVIERALAKARGEKLVRKEIEAGMSSNGGVQKIRNSMSGKHPHDVTASKRGAASAKETL